MTDEQIIKAKKIIKDVYIYLFLSQQKYRAMGFDFCQGDIDCLHDMIDTITRQKAEIERLQAENKQLKRDMSYMASPNTIGDRHEMGCW